MLHEMTIDGISIDAYNARLLSYSVSGTSLTNNTSALTDVMKMPSLFSTVLGTRQLTVTLTFYPHHLGTDATNTSIMSRYAAATENIVAFEAAIIGKIVEISLPDGFLYTAMVNVLSAATFDGSGEHDVTYTFAAIRHRSELTANVEPNGKIICQSTTVCPCKIIVTMPQYTSLMTLMGFLIQRVEAETELIVDSINGTITQGGVNKFLDTTMIEFPKLTPGENIISCSDETAKIKVVYTPIYV